MSLPSDPQESRQAAEVPEPREQAVQSVAEASQSSEANRANEESLYPVTGTEVLFGVLAVLAWLVVFGGGNIIGTSPYRERLGGTNSVSLVLMIEAALITLFFFTPTNLAFLSCFSAITGEFANRSRTSTLLAFPKKRSSESPVLRDVAACYAAAAMRGFVIYLLIISGLLIIAAEPVAGEPNQGHYLRLAGIISVLSFMVGYDTDVFRRAMERIVALISQAPSGEQRIARTEPQARSDQGDHR